VKLRSIVVLSVSVIIVGFSLSSNAQEFIPENASPSIPGPWACDIGYRPVGFTCVEFKLPENAVYDPTGYGFWCARGYRREGDQCVRVVVPANGVLDTVGKGWLCARGYKKEANACLTVKIPENAQLDIYGHDWLCIEGYSKSGDRCISTVSKTIDPAQ
jgi:hypothetical protein